MAKAQTMKPAKAHHPAHNLYLLTLVLLGIMVLFGFISVFVPWVMKELAVGQRAWAYPFKTCIEDTFSKVNAESCLDNDFIEPTGVPLTGGNPQCKAFILSTIAFVFISVILGVVTILMLIGILLTLWSRPMLLASIAQFCLIIVCITAFLSWIMFLCYAFKTCAPNSIFPVHGYSYGFILYIFASTSALAAVVTGFMGISKLKAYQPLADGDSDDEKLQSQSDDPESPIQSYTDYREPLELAVPAESPALGASQLATYPTPQQSFNPNDSPIPHW